MTYNFFLSWQSDTFVVESETDWVSLNPSTTEPLENKGMLMLKDANTKAEMSKKIMSLTILYGD